MKIIPSSITGIKATALQLQMLGHYPGSEVWIKVNNNQPYRCLVTEDWGLDATQALNKKDANGKPRVYPEDGNKIWEADGKNYPNGVEHFQHLANQGCQIFVIPNKARGGIRASDIQRCQHLFAEADDRPIPEQWERLQWFTDVTGLIPCLVIYSGGKSLHFYFALSCAIAPEDWQRLQRKIILIFRSDPQIQNVNREMRLAGVSRKDKEVSIDFASDYSYDPVEFEQRLDSLGYFPHGVTYERWLKARKLLKDKAPDADLLKLLATPEDELFPKPVPRPQQQREFEYNGDTIPLEFCLTRDDKELIAHGVSSGSIGRNPMGFKLACNAIGTASALNSLGIRHSDNGYQLLEEFCRRCNPPLPDREIQRLWRQAQKTNPKAALTDEQLLKRVSYWQWTQLPPATRGSHYTPPRQELDKDPIISRDEWEEKHGFGKFLKSRLSKIFKGFGTRPEPRTRPLRLQVSSDGVTEFQPGGRLKTIAHLRSQGVKFILDRSPTGSGKTHDAGLLYSDEDSKNRTWYLAVNHRNPTTETVERMTDLPPRHNGQVIEAGKLTPLGNHYIRNLRADETPDSLEMTVGNCYRANWFATLREKGYNPEQEQGDGRNPICSKCPMYFNCTRGAGDGYGFLSERREALKANRLRADINSLPQPSEFDYSQDICIVDEAAKYVRGTQSIQARIDEINTLWSRIERVAPDAFEALKPYRFILGEALDGDFDVVQNGRNRGANHERLLDNLPSSHLLIPNLPEVIEQVKRAMPSLEELVVEADSVSGVGGKWKAAGDSVRSHFRRQAAAETLANLQNAPTNILVHVLEIWAGLKRGSVRCYNGTLSVVIPDTRHANLLHAFGTVVLMDATADKRVLAKTLNIDPNEIVEIRQASPKPTNLTVVNVQMPGMGSNQVSDACKQRQENLLNAIYSRHEGQSVKVLANKSDTHLPLDGYWFRDNRGSNEFKGTDVLVAFNTPRPNVGAVEDEYRAIFGSLEGFEAYYQHLQASEIVQLIGRPRANLYPDKEIIIYMVGTGLDLEFLKEYGVKLQTVDAFQICPEAGTPDQVTRWKILEATRLITEQGGKLTQTAIAEVTGKSQELVSKLAKEFGGWQQLKKLLLGLLEPYRGGNNFSALSDEERWLAESYLPALLQESPEVAVEELGQMIRAVGFWSFLRMLSAASPRTQARVLGLVFRGLPHSWRETVCVHLN